MQYRVGIDEQDFYVRDMLEVVDRWIYTFKGEIEIFKNQLADASDAEFAIEERLAQIRLYKRRKVALRKLVAMKPIIIGTRWLKVHKLIDTLGECPRCRSMVRSLKDDYCNKCGQRLRWDK